MPQVTVGFGFIRVKILAQDAAAVAATTGDIEVAQTLLSVINHAFSELGSPPSQSLNDNTPQMNKTNLVVDTFVRKFLAEYSWNGATDYATLAKLDLSKVPGGWDSAFQIPDDCLRVLSVNGDEHDQGSDSWRIVAGRLYTNSDSAEIFYVKHVTNYEHMSAQTVYAMGLDLAAHLASQFGKGANEVAALQARANDAKDEAKAVDGQESSPQGWGDDELISDMI